MNTNTWTSESKPFDMPNITHLVAVSSGKGGVGKSTVALNLALALLHRGHAVGLLDADVYGPSQPTLLAQQNKRPEVVNQRFEPVVQQGLKTISMGYLLDPNTPLVWRGPMIGKALQQLLTDTNWGKLDYLILDLPPGTGDIQLTLAQKVRLSGALMVTTPQEVACVDVIKALQMWVKLSVPVLGIVENMSEYVCAHCGHHDALFGSGGGDRLSAQFHVPVLARIPFLRALVEASDRGELLTLSPDRYPFTEPYHQLAAEVHRLLPLANQPKRFPSIVVDRTNQKDHS